jgi:hypothetical protein
LRTGGGKFADYITLLRSQGIGLTTKELYQTIRHSDKPRENHGGDTVRRSKRLQNVPDSTGFFSQRVGRVQSAPSSLKMENIQEQGTLKELIWVHFPGSEIIPEPSGGWDCLGVPEMERIQGRLGSLKKVISYDKLKWAVFSFQPQALME